MLLLLFNDCQAGKEISLRIIQVTDAQLKATGPPSGGVLGSSENEGMTPTRTGLGTDHEESRIFCKLRRDGSHILELHYNLTMDAERDTGKFDSLELNIDCILSSLQSSVSCVFTKGYRASGI